MQKIFAAFITLVLAGGALSVNADEGAIRAAMLKNYPQSQVQSITKTPIPGVYEVFADGEIIYTNETGSYFFANAVLIDAEKKTNLTQERMSKLTSIKFDQLPLNLAFKRVKGNGSRKMAVFADPDCPFCKQIEADLAKLDNVTIYMFLFPIASLHPQATEHAKQIWCSSDRFKAWDDLMQRGVLPTASSNCNNPVSQVVDFGNRNKINGTPTMFFADGHRVPGALPLAQIEQHLALAAQAK